MKAISATSWYGAALLLAVLGTSVDRPALAQGDPNFAQTPGMELLTRGPVHEAFAEPVIYDPKPGPVVSRRPPDPIDEIPPDQKPQGENVQWIPGYWAWDDQRNDFLWISGLWRDVPPGRHWVPGYWDQAEGGFQWVPGFWAPDDTRQVQYLPEPPQSLEAGPSGPPPSDDSVWAPGTWIWSDGRYAWTPGSWVPYQADWVWVPAHYAWTPSGYLFVDGYWDRPIQQRGAMFAPVYFSQPVYQQPNFTYTPSINILAGSLLSSLFVRPAYQHYYFGDYYAANNFQSGIYPWYSFHQSRYGYDPIFAHYAVASGQRDPHWLDEMHDVYRYRREHPDARPPQTYVQQERMLRENNAAAPPINSFNNTVTNVRNVSRIENRMMAQPIGRVAVSPNAPVRFERLDEERRRELGRRAVDLRNYRDQRVRREDELGRYQAAGPRPQPARPVEPRPAVESRPREEFRPRAVELPRSPIVARPPAPEVQRLPLNEQRRFIPPAAPVRPQPQPNVAIPKVGQVPPRFEPHPDRLPPPAFRPGPRTPEPGQRPGAPRRPEGR